MGEVTHKAGASMCLVDLIACGAEGSTLVQRMTADEAIRLSGELERAALTVRRQLEQAAVERDGAAPDGMAWRIEVQESGVRWHRLPGEYGHTRDAREVMWRIGGKTRLALCESINRAGVQL